MHRGRAPLRAGPVGACVGEVVPQGEVCNGLDDDCDGQTDEDVPCPLCGDGRLDEGETCDDGNLVAGDGCDAACRSEGTPLNPQQAFGAHGNCETFNACGDAATCAQAACTFYGRGTATAWLEGQCESLRAFRPDLVCSLFNQVPNDLDVNWGSGCNIPVAYDVHCSVPAPPRCGDGNLDEGEGCDDGNEQNGDGCSAACAIEVVYGEGYVGSFRVNDGPPWTEATSTSCVSACAQIFGGASQDYACSTQTEVIDHQAWGDAWADASHCLGGTPLAEDHVLPAEGAAYDCGAFGCSASAYVSDHCDDASVNHCFRPPAPPCPGEQFGSVCLVALSEPCVIGSAAAWCAAQAGQVITAQEFRDMAAAGWQRPDGMYHTLAVTEHPDCEGGFGNVSIPGFNDFSLWICGESTDYCNRAVACVQRGAAP